MIRIKKDGMEITVESLEEYNIVTKYMCGLTVGGSQSSRNALRIYGLERMRLL